MLKAGDSLSDYRLVESIGTSSHSNVWKAIDTRSDRAVAIKLLPWGLARDPEAISRLREEIDRVASLASPTIVGVEAIETVGENSYLVMELVPGRTLAEEIRPGGLPLETILARTLPLTETFRRAHEQGITHRHLRPRLILIDEAERLRILGFGQAMLGESGLDLNPDPSEAPTLTLSQERLTAENVGYMSPEQIQAMRPIDHRADIFSLAAIVYEMATGRRPYDGESTADVVVAMLRDEPRSITECNPALPGEFERIVRQGLEKNRQRRVQTIETFHDELARLGLPRESGPTRSRGPIPYNGAGAL